MSALRQGLECTECPVELKDVISHFRVGKSRYYMIGASTCNVSYLPCYTFRLPLTKLTDSIQVVGRSKQSSLDEETIRILEEVLPTAPRCTVGSAVTEYSQVLIRERIFVCSRRERQRNSYTVTYAHCGYVFYGSVERLITLQSTSNVNVHAAIVRPYEVGPCEMIHKLNFPSEIACIRELLSNDFVSVHMTCSQHLIAIPLENIIMQCFDASISDRSIVTVMLQEYDSK